MTDYDKAFASAFGKGDAEKASPYDDVMRNSLRASVQPALDYSKESNSTPVDFKGNLKIGSFDTGIPLPESVNKRLAQLGSGFADLGMAFAKPDAVDEKRKIDSALLDSGAAKGLHFMGKALPASAIPQIGGPVIGGVLAGGLMGAVEPVGTGESRLSNMAMSAALGGAIPGAVKTAQWAVRPDAAKQALAQSALDKGIPIGLSDMTDNGLVKGARSVLNDVPFVGSIGAKQGAAKQAGFNRAVGDVIGANADSLTPDVMAASKARIVGELDRVWNNPMDYNANLFGTFRKAESLANDLPKADANRLTGWITDLESKVVQDANGGLSIPGQVANRFQSNLRQLADKTQGMSQNDLHSLRKDFIGEFNSQIGGADAEALTLARKQYGAYKTLEPLMNSAEAGVAGRSVGDVPAALLPGKVVQQYGSSAKSPFGDLPQIGSQFVVDRTPLTGGSPRAAIQNTLVGAGLMGGGGAGAGAILAGGAGAAAGGIGGLGLAALIEKALGSPDIARSVLMPQVRRGLLDSPELGPTVLELLKNSASRLPVAAGMGLLSAPALE